MSWRSISSNYFSSSQYKRLQSNTKRRMSGIQVARLISTKSMAVKKIHENSNERNERSIFFFSCSIPVNVCHELEFSFFGGYVAVCELLFHFMQHTHCDCRRHRCDSGASRIGLRQRAFYNFDINNHSVHDVVLSLSFAFNFPCVVWALFCCELCFPIFVQISMHTM